MSSSVASSPAKRQRTEAPRGPPEIALYSYWRSSCSWRVRIALAWKELAYEYRAVHLVKSEQKADEYTELNKGQVVPTLVYDGDAVCQSMAILEFLEEKHPEKALLPRDPLKRAKVRELMGMIGCDIQPVQNLRVLLKHIEDAPAEEKDARKAGWAKHWITFGFECVERALQGCAGTYCVGDEVTLADAFLVPQVYNANRYAVDMAKFPTISRIHAALEALPAFQRAHPSKQPDAQ
mmetsp:Transcript_16398/g.52144  ORF Transcript_16398/g.52144 Transcript_16398/m.52144 type:complete len:236 (-) Transcript_16398:563-1270(-)